MNGDLVLHEARILFSAECRLAAEGNTERELDISFRLTAAKKKGQAGNIRSPILKHAGPKQVAPCSSGCSVLVRRYWTLVGVSIHLRLVYVYVSVCLCVYVWDFLRACSVAPTYALLYDGQWHGYLYTLGTTVCLPTCMRAWERESVRARGSELV